jgi:flagellar FliJ protein
MNSADTQTLEILLEREEGDRDTAMIALRQAERHLTRVDQQMTQFETYRADYVARWQEEFQHAGGIEILHCYRSFMQRLDDALGQLTAQQVHAQASVRRCQTMLLEAETRVAAIRKLIERRVESHERVERRREQKHTDEIAQRAAWMGAGTGVSLGVLR